MRFKDFLLVEARNDRPSPTEFDDEEFVEWCEKNCSNFLRTEHIIYRGMHHDVDCGVIDTNEFNRKSANTSNFYTIWMDNHPTWSKFPKRSKAYIASGDEPMYARGFGKLHILIPTDRSQIGVCCETDLWFSFPHFKDTKVTGAAFMEMGDEMYALRGAFTYLSEKNGIGSVKAAEDDYQTLCTFLKAATPEVLEIVSKTEYRGDVMKKRAEFMVAKGIANLYDLWVNAMDPKKNKFIHCKASDFKGSAGNEIWVQGKVGIIDIDALGRSPVLTNFVRKYYGTKMMHFKDYD